MKVVLCQQHSQTGHCARGAGCKFAHGLEDLHAYSRGESKFHDQESLFDPSLVDITEQPSQPRQDDRNFTIQSITGQDISQVEYPSEPELKKRKLDHSEAESRFYNNFFL